MSEILGFNLPSGWSGDTPRKPDSQPAPGGVSHEVWVDRPGEITAAVAMANDDDGHYVQYFRSRHEVEEFIARLNAVADEAWPVLA